MSAADVTGGNIMGASAALLNNASKSVYTYAAQSPYLRLSLQELRELFELNNIPVTQNTSAVVTLNAGVTQIIYNAAGTPTNPKLPDDMVEPAQLWERATGIDPSAPVLEAGFYPRRINAGAVLISSYLRLQVPS